MTDTSTAEVASADSDTDSDTGSTSRSPRRRLSPGWFGTRFAVIGVWILLIVLFGVLRPDTFLTPGAWRSIFGGPNNTALIFLAAALLCTIIVGEFVDMSVANNFGFAAIIVTVVNTDLHINGWVAALIAVAASTAVGAVNGWLVVRVGVNTIVVTLGMGTFIFGLSLWFANLNR